MNAYYPLALQIRGKRCLVVGGGRVAYRKTINLLQSGAVVKVVAPAVIRPLVILGDRKKIRIAKRPFKPADLRGVYLVFAATDDSSLNRMIYRETRSNQILVNVVDDPEYCDFIMPAVLKKGKVTITVSTDGCAPYAAVHIKKRIDKLLNPEYMQYIQTIIRVRSRLIKMKKSGTDINIEHVLDKLSAKRLLHYIKEKDPDSLRRYIDYVVSSDV